MKAAKKESLQKVAVECMFSGKRQKTYSEVYLDRVQSQEELAKLLGYCMKDKEKIHLDEFTQITEKLSCEMFLCV